MPRLTKIAAVLVAVLVGAAVVIPMAITRTVGGREWARGVAEKQLTGVLGGRGSVQIGGVERLSVNAAALRDLRLRDRWGHDIAHIDSARIRIDLGALTRKVLHFRSIELHGASLDVVQRFDSVWNVVSLLADSSGPRRAVPGWGDDVYTDTVRLRGSRARVAMLWAPHRTFTLARERDSVTALYRTLHDVRDTAGRMMVTRRYEALSADLVDAHFTRPSGGGRVVLSRLATRMSDPALAVRDARGTLEWTPEKRMNIDLSQLLLGESRGAVRGTVSWADRGPVRYDLVVPTDSVALADVNWIWPALPTSGGGRTVLTVRSQADADVVDYTLDSLQLRAEESDVRGRVTVTVGPREIALSRMALRLAPLTAPVWRRLTESELPAVVAGAVSGTVHAASGGPLTAVRIDSAALSYRERTGDVARVAFAGVVGSGVGIITRDLRIQTLELPLTIAKPLVTEWPAGLEGLLRVDGVITADVARGDVDARSAHLQLLHPSGHRATVTGRVRGTRLLSEQGTVDVDLRTDQFDPRVLGSLSDSLPLRGPLSGHVEARGPLSRLFVSAEITPAPGAGQLRARGTLARTPRTIGFDGTVSTQAFDLRAALTTGGLPTTAIAGDVDVLATLDRANATLPWRLSVGALRGRLTQPDSGALLSTTLSVDARIDQDALFVRDAELVLPGARALMVGALRRDSLALTSGWVPRVVSAAGDTIVGDSLNVAVRVDSLPQLARALRRWSGAFAEGDTVRAQLAALPDSVTGDAFLTAHLTGAVNAPRGQASFDVRRLVAGTVRVGDLTVHASSRRPFVADVRVDATDVRAATVGFRTITIAADSLTRDGARVVARAEGGDDVVIDAGTVVTRATNATVIALNTFRAAGKGARLELLRPGQLTIRPDRTELDSIELRATNGGTLSLAAQLPNQGTVSGAINARGLPLADVGALLEPPRTLRGTMSGRVTMAGTRDAPTLDWYVRGDSLGADSVAIAGIEGDGSYADRELFGSLLIDVREPSSTRRLATTALRGSFSLPVDLALRDRDARLLERPLNARLDIDSLSLGELPLNRGGVRDVRGIADGHLLIAGTPRAPRVEGALTIANGRLTAEAAGLDLRDIALVARGSGREIELERLRMTSGDVAADSLSLRGKLRLADTTGDRGLIDVSGTVRDFAVLRRGDIADVDLTGTLEAGGTLDSVVVTSNLTVPRGTIYRDAVESRAAIDLSSAEAMELLGADAPVVPKAAAFDLEGVARRIRRSAIRIRAGDELWVRAPTVAAKVGGEVTLVVDRGSLVPTGELTAQRGLYRLDLGVVRRTFDVDSGRVRFFGDAAIPPTVNVWASHNVRQASGGETKVLATLSGTLERPTLALSTDDAIGGRVPDTEVISLLLFGAPTFALDGTSQSTVQSVTNVLLPSVGGYVEGALGRLLPVFNTVQLTTAGGAESTRSRFDLLNNVALSAGKQIGDRTFIRLNSGICRGTADAARDLTPWLGLAIEYRLSPALSAQASADPGTAPCNRVGTDALSRLQFGFDLFHNWIF
jgi:translocation and assembly module TamB